MSDIKRGGRRRRNVKGGASKKKLDPKKVRMTPAQRKLAQREREGRRLGLEEARKAQAAIDARIAREALEPPVGAVPGAMYRPPTPPPAEPPAPPPEPPARVIPKQRVPRIPADAQGDGQYTMGQARSMLRAGYHIDKVIRVTGWGMKAFDDMEVDEDGYGLPLIP